MERANHLLSCVFAGLASGVMLPALHASILYYNDGTVADFDASFGDIGIGVPWNASFGPGGFMDGTSDDVPPFNTIDNRGLVTLQGAAGGTAGGGFMKRITDVTVDHGVIILTYGTQGQQKASQGSAWEARVKEIGLALGIKPSDAVAAWRARNPIANPDGSIQVKVVRYIGDPLVSIPPDDLLATELDPIDLGAIGAAVSNPNTLLFFWETSGSRPMNELDLLFGDFELNTGYTDLLHHFPYVAVLGGVGPADLGVDPASATMLRLSGDGLPGTDPFAGAVFIATADPILPEPSTLALTLSALAISLLCVARRRTRAAVAVFQGGPQKFHPERSQLAGE